MFRSPVTETAVKDRLRWPLNGRLTSTTLSMAKIRDAAWCSSGETMVVELAEINSYF
jgi:hypothetical protein